MAYGLNRCSSLMYRYRISDCAEIQIRNNNEYLERLTRTGPKRLHVHYKYIFVKIQCTQHECTHTHMHTHIHALTAGPDPD